MGVEMHEGLWCHHGTWEWAPAAHCWARKISVGSREPTEIFVQLRLYPHRTPRPHRDRSTPDTRPPYESFAWLDSATPCPTPDTRPP